MKDIQKILLKEAKKAYLANEVPVGCVIVYKDKIISKAHNLKQKTHCVTNHAEIIAINKAAKKLKDWRLEDCILYVTLEPCKMCQEVIRQSRIKKVYYLIKSEFKNENNKNIEYTMFNCDNNEQYLSMLKQFFNNKR